MLAQRRRGGPAALLLAPSRITRAMSQDVSLGRRGAELRISPFNKQNLVS